MFGHSRPSGESHAAKPRGLTYMLPSEDAWKRAVAPRVSGFPLADRHRHRASRFAIRVARAVTGRENSGVQRLLSRYRR